MADPFVISERAPVSLIIIRLDQTKQPVEAKMEVKGINPTCVIRFDLDAADLTKIKNIIIKHTDTCPLDDARCEKHEV